MSCLPRVTLWKFLLLVALLLNVLLIYSHIIQRYSYSGRGVVCNAAAGGGIASDARQTIPNAAVVSHKNGGGGSYGEDIPAVRPAAVAIVAEAAEEDFSIDQLVDAATKNKADCARHKKNSFSWFLCLAEASVVFHSPRSKPLVLIKDVTRSRYFAQRDLQGWSMAFQKMGFAVEEVHGTSVRTSDFSVFLCLSIASQDKLCLKPSSYHLLGQGQRFNQIHGIRESLWRKDGMCLTLREALGSYRGPKNFTFTCWVLPADMDEFHEKMKTDRQPYIIKPSDKGEGHGIFIAQSVDELDTKTLTRHVAQPLLTNPYLIQGRKFDFRTYVLLTSVSPLRAYFYHEGLVRFASSPYNSSEANRGKESQVLTNTSIGKKYTHLSNLTWTFQRLKHYLSTLDVDTEHLFSSIHEAIVRTLLSAEYRLLRDIRVSLGGYSCTQCYQLLGVDVILDSDLNPYVIEVNGLPSMQLSNELGVPPDPTNPYTATKLGLLHDMLQIIFNSSTSVLHLVRHDLESLRVGLSPGPLCRPPLHVYCIDLRDLQNIVQSRREFQHRGNFTRIYPSPDGQKYSKLIHHMHQLVEKRFRTSGVANRPKTLWDRHHLHLALESLWTLQ